MGRDALLNLTVGVLTTVTVGLLAGPAWPAWVMGAVIALALAVGVAIQVSTAQELRFDLRPRTYAIGAAVTVAVGLVFAVAHSDAFWPVGVIVGIVLAPYAERVVGE